MLPFDQPAKTCLVDLAGQLKVVGELPVPGPTRFTDDPACIDAGRLKLFGPIATSLFGAERPRDPEQGSPR
jgi:hypothetical protein